MIDDGMIGAIKIKDGIFIGDELASKVDYKEKKKNLFKVLLHFKIKNNFFFQDKLFFCF